MPDYPDVGAVIPLESNPEIFTEFARKLGLSPLLEFTDIYSISDPTLLSFLPRPINAIILLFPISAETEFLRKSEDSKPDDQFENILWFKQLLKNACGLYAMLHALSNLPKGLLVNHSSISNFTEEVKILGDDVNNKNYFIEKTKLISNLSLTLYDQFSKQGQTEAPSADSDTDLHFITYIKGKDGNMFELDGRRNGPIDLGKEETDGDVIDSKLVINRIEQYMKLADDKNKLKFSMIGLAPSMD